MYILGINAYHGDVSCVLLRGGVLVAALEEERFRRVKHWAGFPTLAIRRSLDMAGVDASAISHVAISRKPRAHLLRKIAFTLGHRPAAALVVDRLRNSRRVAHLHEPLAEALEVRVESLPRLHFVEHHPAHLASAFYMSPYEEAAVCAIDGFGDFVSTSTALGRGHRIDILDRVFFPHSLGILYSAVTQYLGFSSYGDEFKVMGLAPYGEPSFTTELRKLVTLLPGGRFKLDLRYFRHWSDGVEMEWSEGYPTLGRLFTSELDRLLGPRRQPGEEVTHRHEAIARSLQAVYEECLFHVLRGLRARVPSANLCLAGGCAMNSVANGKIRENTPFENIYVQPAAGDNGTALGAAYHVWHVLLRHRTRFFMSHAYWGTEYPTVDAAAMLADAKSTASVSISTAANEDELCQLTAQLIAEGNVVGWFQGRMEWGSRALGNRSILADPRRADMRELINTKIKFRERFRPFAPSLVEDALDEYFVGAAPDPFMQQVYPVRPDRRALLPAITHVDGSGRLQTVTEESNQLYYRLLREFGRLTGVPMLLNTSFNENEPIVDTPSQALDCFLRTRMDVIVVGNTIIRRTPACSSDEALGQKHDHA